MKSILSFLIALCINSLSLAQENIETDRPDQTDGATVVGKRRFQLESSILYNHYDDHPSSLISANLLRYGLAKRLELRLIVEQGLERHHFISESTQSSYPFALGAKASILEEGQVVPAISLIGSLQLPITNTRKEPDYWSAALLMVIDKSFGPVSVTFNAGARQGAFDPAWQWQATNAYKFSLSKKTDVYVEYYGSYQPGEAPTHCVDGGILYYIHPKLMISLSGGGSVAHSPNNYFIGTGCAYNFH